MVLRTAVVGAGVVSASHLSGLDRCPQTDLVAVCDIDDSRARSAAAEYDIEPYFDLEDLLAAEDLDWLHVCTSVQTHLPLARLAIEAGVPVLIQKPIVENVDQFEELEQLATSRGVPTSVVHQHLYDPAMRRATARLRDSDLGTVHSVDLVFNGLTPPDQPNRGSWALELSGGEFEEGLPHPVYLAIAAAGYPRSADDVWATTSLINKYDRPFAFDNAQAGYVEEGGTLCNMTVTSGTIPQRLLIVDGEEKSLIVDFISQTVETLDRDYRASSLSRVLNNLDRAGDRLGGVVSNARLVARSTLDSSWEAQKRANPLYYLIDREAQALADGDDRLDALERARWTTTVLEAIRTESASAATGSISPVEEA